MPRQPVEDLMNRLLTSSVAVCAAVLSVGLAACDKPAAAPAPAPAPVVAPMASSQPVKTGSNDDHHSGGGADREHVDNDGVIRRGIKLSEGAAVTVAVAAQKAKELDGKNLKIEGKVEQVCQAMGCWFIIQGDSTEQTIRITSKGHDVFVPKGAAGRIAVVEGEFKVKTLDKATAQHFEDERKLGPGEQRKVITTDQQELSLSVTALEMRNPA
jgi:hypothetical protein